MSDERDNKDIALIMQDITYIKGDMAEIKAALKILLEGYMPRTEIESKMNSLQVEMDERMKGANTRIDTKASKEDFKELEKTVKDHIVGGTIKWGSIAQSIITTVLTTAIIGALAFTALTQ